MWTSNSIYIFNILLIFFSIKNINSSNSDLKYLNILLFLEIDIYKNQSYNIYLKGVMMNEQVKIRKSIRTYTGEALKKEDLKIVKNFLEVDKNKTGLFDNKVRTILLDGIDEKIKLGTYGAIKGAKTYLAIITKHSDQALIDAGFIIEKLTLELLKKEIYTCVLAGSYKKSDVAFDIKDDEIIVAILPLGYKEEKRRIRENIQRKILKADNRKNPDELFFNYNMEPLKNITTELQQLRLAPSSMNGQPWRIIKEKNKYIIYVEKNIKIENHIGFDSQWIDMGAAIYNLIVDSEKYKIVKSPSIDNIPNNWIYITTVEL